MSIFKSIEEAEKIAVDKLKPLGFCPFINSACTVSCVCYCPPSVKPWKNRNNEIESYSVYDPYCVNSSMFKIGE